MCVCVCVRVHFKYFKNIDHLAVSLLKSILLMLVKSNNNNTMMWMEFVYSKKKEGYGMARMMGTSERNGGVISNAAPIPVEVMTSVRGV